MTKKKSEEVDSCFSNNFDPQPGKRQHGEIYFWKPLTEEDDEEELAALMECIRKTWSHEETKLSQPGLGSCFDSVNLFSFKNKSAQPVQ